jgi:hypothetical protein
MLRRFSWGIVLLAIALTLLLQPGGNANRVQALMAFVPTFPIETARHLVQDSDAKLRAFGEDAGSLALRTCAARLREGLEQDSYEAYRRAVPVVLPALERLSLCFAQVYDDQSVIHDTRFQAALGLAEGFRLNHTLREFEQTARQPNLEPGEVLARCDDFNARFQALGYERGVMLVERLRCSAMIKQGDPRRYGLMLSTLDRARRLGDSGFTCQILGEIGAIHLSRGDVDSMQFYYDEAYRIAMRHRLPDQAARLIDFAANRKTREGRLALATELSMRAQSVCRELHGGGYELRFVLASIGRFADLGCWEAVEQQLSRCPSLLRQIQADTILARTFQLDLERCRARALMARGQVDSATKVYERIRDAFFAYQVRPGYAAMLLEWASGLADAGVPDQALPLVEEGLAYCDSLNVPEVALPLSIEHAEVLFDLAHYDDAGRALDDCDVRAAANHVEDLGRLALERQTLRAKLQNQRGASAEARETLVRARADLDAYARRLDAGPQAYLALEDRRDLRLAMHEIVATTPELGYRLEMEWRELPREFRHANESSPAAAPAARSKPPSLRAGDTHCAYLVLPAVTLRWTATSHGVTRDTLGMTRDQCVGRVQRVSKLLAVPVESRTKGEALELAELLRRLAAILLPDSVLNASPGTTFYVSADGPLASLPFEALDIAPDKSYEPLAQRTDVAYARTGPGASAPRASGVPVVVADPTIPAGVLRRYPALGSLDRARSESAIVSAAWPGTRVLAGSQATKDSVLDAWAHASRIYVAAHVARVPEIPFLTFVPLAVPDGADESQAYLAIKVVRSLDLSGCELSVLSACASGAPYVERERVAPSMGDAFLDAGARAVVQTFLPLSDADASPFATRFLTRWDGGREDVVRALNRARREDLVGTSRAADPAAWATWSVSVREVPGASRSGNRSMALGSHRPRHGAVGAIRYSALARHRRRTAK